jgi:hypothetical protein
MTIRLFGTYHVAAAGRAGSWGCTDQLYYGASRSGWYPKKNDNQGGRTRMNFNDFAGVAAAAAAF